jgi:ferric enterobactin receptor
MKIFKIIRLTVFALFQFLSLMSYGQSNNSKITGIVMNGKDEASSFTSIGLFRSADSLLYKGTLTTEQGNYTFQNIPEGSYYLSVSTMGYRRSNSKPILISKDTQLNLGMIILEREDFQLNEVSIVSKKPLIENLIDKTVLNIENSVLAAGNTALELLQKAPGVSVDNKQISLRGKSNVMIMIDGKSTYLSQDEVSNLLASTQSSAIQSIEIITNPSSKYDAAGNAGIINIKMKKSELWNKWFY